MLIFSIRGVRCFILGKGNYWIQGLSASTSGRWLKVSDLGLRAWRVGGLVKLNI